MSTPSQKKPRSWDRLLLPLLGLSVMAVIVVYATSGRESDFERESRLGDERAAEGQNAQALEHYREAQNLESDATDIQDKLSTLEDRLMDEEEAASIVRFAEQIRAQNPHEAANLYRFALSISPTLNVEAGLQQAIALSGTAPNVEPSPDFRQAVAHFEAQRYEFAYPILLRNAERGHLWSQTHVAWMNDVGRGVAPNPATAVVWYKRAAQQGDARAQVQLGTMLASGRGVDQDLREGVRWFRRSAQRGDTYAMNLVGESYRDGRGVHQDDAEARRWFEQAAGLGNALGQGNLGDFYRDGRGDLTPDTTRALTMYRKAIMNASKMRATAVVEVYQNRIRALGELP